jgi:hypothetical protein
MMRTSTFLGLRPPSGRTSCSWSTRISFTFTWRAGEVSPSSSKNKVPHGPRAADHVAKPGIGLRISLARSSSLAPGRRSRSWFSADSSCSARSSRALRAHVGQRDADVFGKGEQQIRVRSGKASGPETVIEVDDAGHALVRLDGVAGHLACDNNPLEQ